MFPDQKGYFGHILSGHKAYFGSEQIPPSVFFFNLSKIGDKYPLFWHRLWITVLFLWIIPAMLVSDKAFDILRRCLIGTIDQSLDLPPDRQLVLALALECGIASFNGGALAGILFLVDFHLGAFPGHLDRIQADTDHPILLLRCAVADIPVFTVITGSRGEMSAGLTVVDTGMGRNLSSRTALDDLVCSSMVKAVTSIFFVGLVPLMLVR